MTTLKKEAMTENIRSFTETVVDLREAVTHCGFVAILGRPNVGKSTLLNALLGKKISITSRKPQTTRHRCLGVKTSGSLQVIYIDTPGMQDREKSALNDYMNQAARSALIGADIVLFVVDALKWNPADEAVLMLLNPLECPVILVVNKIDSILNKTQLLSYLAHLEKRYPFKAVIPLSSKFKKNLNILELTVARLLTPGPHYFSADAQTDRPLRFRMAEIIREKIIRLLGDELPYVCTVVIEDYQSQLAIPVIQATIFVEKAGQKFILIGKKGEKIKKIGTQARRDLEILITRHLHLKLWVKVRASWSTNALMLNALGYD